MKRKIYEIKCGNKTEIKYAWNSAVKEGKRLISEIANAEQSDYNRVDMNILKTGNDLTSGTFTWAGDNGKVAIFTIQKIQ